MDAVNRQVSMRMMVCDGYNGMLTITPWFLFLLQIDAARASLGVQYVLITPQNMSQITLGPYVTNIGSGCVTTTN